MGEDGNIIPQEQQVIELPEPECSQVLPKIELTNLWAEHRLKAVPQKTMSQQIGIIPIPTVLTFQRDVLLIGRLAEDHIPEEADDLPVEEVVAEVDDIDKINVALSINFN